MTEYAYLRDGSVLGRVTGWRGDVPIIDTTDRRPDAPSSASSDLAGLPTASEPDGALDETSWPPAAVTGGGRVPHGLSSPAAVHPPIAAGPSHPSAGVTG